MCVPQKASGIASQHLQYLGTIFYLIHLVFELLLRPVLQYHQNLKPNVCILEMNVGVYLDIAVSECDTTAKVVSTSDMSVK